MTVDVDVRNNLRRMLGSDRDLVQGFRYDVFDVGQGWLFIGGRFAKLFGILEGLKKIKLLPLVGVELKWDKSVRSASTIQSNNKSVTRKGESGSRIESGCAYIFHNQHVKWLLIGRFDQLPDRCVWTTVHATVVVIHVVRMVRVRVDSIS